MTVDSHRPPGSGCAINAAIELLGHPWSMLVLRDVSFGRSSAQAGASATPLARLLTKTHVPHANPSRSGAARCGGFGRARRTCGHEARLCSTMPRDDVRQKAEMAEVPGAVVGVPRPIAAAQLLAGSAQFAAVDQRDSFGRARRGGHGR